MKKQLSDIESMMQYNDEQDFQEHCDKIERACLELVERKVSFSPAILYIREVK